LPCIYPVLIGFSKSVLNNPPNNLEKGGRIHRPQGERKEINVVSVGNCDIPSGNILKERRKK
jgi:hypothetical protein